MRSCLLPSRLSFAVIALLIALAVLPADTRAAPAQAGVVLKPGDFIAGSTAIPLWIERTSGNYGALISDKVVMRGSPLFVAAGPAGEVFVASNSYRVDDFKTQPAIVRVNPATGQLTVIASNDSGWVSGLTADPHGRLLYVEWLNRRIVRIDPLTGARTLLSSNGLLSYAQGLAVEADGSVLTTAAVTSAQTDGPRQIIRIQSGTGEQRVVSTGGLFVRPTYLAVGPDGAIYVSDIGGNITKPRVIKIHPQNGAQSVISASNLSPEIDSLYGIAVDNAGAVYVLARLNAPASLRVYRVELDSGQLTPISVAFITDDPVNLAIVKAPSAVVVECTPRPPVSVQTSKLETGRLQVTVKVSGTGNTIRSIRPGSPPNATLDTQPTINGAEATFVLRRTGPGAVTLPFTVTDACGDWPSFVGGGPNAF